MEYFAQYGGTTQSPEQWAAAREEEGWHGVSAPDHFLPAGRTAHLFVTLARLVAATSRVRVASAFANNLIRSPVEFAHAALALQQASSGRFEAGLGSGWDRAEIHAIGGHFDEGPVRARRYFEAVTVVRELLRDGRCRFDGEHYHIDVPALGPAVDTPPPLVVSLAGPWTIRHIAPLADRVEMAAPGPTNFLRGGTFDSTAIRTCTMAEFCDAITRVRAANPSVPISAGLLFAVGEPAATSPIASLFDRSVFDGLAGSAETVAANLARFADEGVSRLTSMPMTPTASPTSHPCCSRREAEPPNGTARDKSSERSSSGRADPIR